MTTKKKRGFALIGAGRLREISSKGGRAAHASGKARQFKAGGADAIAAGTRGGRAVAVRYGKEHMAALGRRGAAASWAKRRARAGQAG